MDSHPILGRGPNVPDPVDGVPRLQARDLRGAVLIGGTDASAGTDLDESDAALLNPPETDDCLLVHFLKAPDGREAARIEVRTSNPARAYERLHPFITGCANDARPIAGAVTRARQSLEKQIVEARMAISRAESGLSSPQP